ncbi:MAG TPA: LemA family protein [Deltaproteobacteria bacterium]|nr:LemA family protein [Deltaproteobacteria bacterium]
MDAKKRNLIIGIVVVIIIVFAFYSLFAGNYNKFVKMDVAIETAWSQVENQLQRRYDLIPNLVETVKGYAKQEREVFIKVTEARAKVGGAGTVSDKITANNELSGALSRLLLVVERYPDIKSNQNFLRLQDELAGTENRIAVERMRYNEAVKVYNEAVRSFPANMIAAMFGFKEHPYFEAPKEAQAPPQVKFD